ncbi:MAG: hypothetical protein NC311_15115 [Muribaculaceae bacterium]|nr:hypothetical protein [Muribaculaceae bacterium]MCM1400349.1 hypothetical protein [Clostridium sp.]MCM1461054.1 hypothetical protein [Bacteroides sp.]
MNETSTGKCRYCNQITYLNQNMTEDEAEETATLGCNCFKGRDYRERVKRIEKTNNNIDLAFMEDFPQTAELFRSAVPAIMDGKIVKVSIDTGQGIKGVIGTTQKGSLKVERTASKKVTYEE